jgi:hypothetical protein
MAYRRYLAVGILLAAPVPAWAEGSPCDEAFGELIRLSAPLSECEMNRFMFERIPSILGRCSAEERQVLEESREGFAEDMQRLCPPPVPVSEAPKETASPPVAAKMPEFPKGLE